MQTYRTHSSEQQEPRASATSSAAKGDSSSSRAILMTRLNAYSHISHSHHQGNITDCAAAGGASSSDQSPSSAQEQNAGNNNNTTTADGGGGEPSWLETAAWIRRVALPEDLAEALMDKRDGRYPSSTSIGGGGGGPSSHTSPRTRSPSVAIIPPSSPLQSSSTGAGNNSSFTFVSAPTMSSNSLGAASTVRGGAEGAPLPQLPHRTAEDDDVRIVWNPLLCNVARAVLQVAPWQSADVAVGNVGLGSHSGNTTTKTSNKRITASTPMTAKLRDEIMQVVLQRFIDHLADIPTIQRHVNELLGVIKKEDPVMAIHSQLAAFVKAIGDGVGGGGKSSSAGGASSGAHHHASISTIADALWEGHDTYRRRENWCSVERLWSFRTTTDERIRERFKLVDAEVSRARDAVAHWEACTVKGDTRCFCHYDPLPIGLPPSMTSAAADVTASQQSGVEVSIRLDSLSSSLPPTAAHAGKKRPPVVHLPSNAVVRVALTRDGKEIDSNLVKGRASRRPTAANSNNDDANTLFWGSYGAGGSEITFAIPASSAAANDGSGLLTNRLGDVTSCAIVVDVEEARMCGVFGGKRLAHIIIPMNVLFTNIAPFNSNERAEVAKARAARNDTRPVGVHFLQGKFADHTTGVSIAATLSLKCCDPKHNQRPPCLDVVSEQKRFGGSMATSTTTNDQTTAQAAVQHNDAVDTNADVDWLAVDHHAQFVELADILGELTDHEHYALQLFADRFFIHDELFEAATLASAATRGNFAEEGTRRDMASACELLAEAHRRPSTLRGLAYTAHALNIVASQCRVRVQALEEVTTDASQGRPMMEACYCMLNVIAGALGGGGAPADGYGYTTSGQSLTTHEQITALVEQHGVEMGEYFRRKLEVLRKYVISNRGAAIAFAGGGINGGVSHAASLSQEDALMTTAASPDAIFLPELEKRPDWHTLLAKTFALREIVENVMFCLKRILEFAADANDFQITENALKRTSIIIERIVAPFTLVMEAILRGITRGAGTIDWAVDIFYLVVSIYEKIDVDFIASLALVRDLPPVNGNYKWAEHNFECILAPFDGFWELWLPIWEPTVLRWLQTLVAGETLTPLIMRAHHRQDSGDGNPVASQSAAVTHGRSVLNSAAGGFRGLLNCVDDQTQHYYILLFAKLLYSASDAFIDATEAKVKASAVPLEWMVGLCDISAFSKVVEKIWAKEVPRRLDRQRDCFATSDAVRTEISEAHESCRRQWSQIVDRFRDGEAALCDFIADSLRGATLGFLNVVSDAVAEHPNTTAEEYKKMFRDVGDRIAVELAILADNYDDGCHAVQKSTDVTGSAQAADFVSNTVSSKSSFAGTAPLLAIFGPAAGGLHAAFAEFVTYQSQVKVVDSKKKIAAVMPPPLPPSTDNAPYSNHDGEGSSLKKKTTNAGSETRASMISPQSASASKSLLTVSYLTFEQRCQPALDAIEAALLPYVRDECFPREMAFYLQQRSQQWMGWSAQPTGALTDLLKGKGGSNNTIPLASASERDSLVSLLVERANRFDDSKARKYVKEYVADESLQQYGGCPSRLAPQPKAKKKLGFFNW